MADIREKIAMLLNLAGNNPSENEAKAAFLKARELMVKYKLKPEDCEEKGDRKVVRELLDITFTAMTDSWGAALSAVIAEHYCCRSFRCHAKRGKKYQIGLVGLEKDFAVAKQILLFAYDSVISTRKTKIKKVPGEPASVYREKCNAYGWGFVHGVKATFKEQDQEHQDWGLVLVVPQAVDDSMNDMGKKTPFGKEKVGGWHDQYRAMGFQEGKKFDPSSKLPQENKEVII